MIDYCISPPCVWQNPTIKLVQDGRVFVCPTCLTGYTKENLEFYENRLAFARTTTIWPSKNTSNNV